MAERVGLRGELVIEPEIMEQLGITPGCEAIQRVVDGRLEVRFTGNVSLCGILRRYLPPDFRHPTDEELDRAIEESVSAEQWEKELRIRADEAARKRGAD